jgi:hypothetical protein
MRGLWGRGRVEPPNLKVQQPLQPGGAAKGFHHGVLVGRQLDIYLLFWEW